jgi:hypothetical protein
MRGLYRGSGLNLFFILGKEKGNIYLSEVDTIWLVTRDGYIQKKRQKGFLKIGYPCRGNL